jgi:hypothetical protein
MNRDDAGAAVPVKIAGQQLVDCVRCGVEEPPLRISCRCVTFPAVMP